MNKSGISRNNSLFIPRKQQYIENDSYSRSPDSFRNKYDSKHNETGSILSRGDVQFPQ